MGMSDRDFLFADNADPSSTGSLGSAGNIEQAPNTVDLGSTAPKDPFGNTKKRELSGIEFAANVDSEAMAGSGGIYVHLLTCASSETMESANALANSAYKIATLYFPAASGIKTTRRVNLNGVKCERYLGAAFEAVGDAVTAGKFSVKLGHMSHNNFGSEDADLF